jgi:hypothetical protein
MREIIADKIGIVHVTRLYCRHMLGRGLPNLLEPKARGTHAQKLRPILMQVQHRKTPKKNLWKYKREATKLYVYAGVFSGKLRNLRKSPSSDLQWQA